MCGAVRGSVLAEGKSDRLAPALPLTRLPHRGTAKGRTLGAAPKTVGPVGFLKGIQSPTLEKGGGAAPHTPMGCADEKDLCRTPPPLRAHLVWTGADRAPPVQSTPRHLPPLGTCSYVPRHLSKGVRYLVRWAPPGQAE